MRTRFTDRLFTFVAWTALGAALRDAFDAARTSLAPLWGGTETEFATGATEAVKRWATRVWIEAAREIYWSQFFGEDDNRIIQVKTELEKASGDKVTFSLVRKITNTGVADDADLEGQEQPLEVYSDSVTLAQRRQAIRLKGRMSERRTAFNQRMIAKDTLKKWLAEYIDDTIFTEMDSSPTTVVFGGTASSTATITAADKFTPALIDKCVAKARKATPKIWPVRINGKSYWVIVLHSDVAYDLKQDPTWQQAQRDANVRSMGDNPIFSGADGYWGGAVIHSHEKVPLSTTYGAGANLPGASNPFLGKQAGVFAWGARPEAWEKTFDYEAKTGFACGAIFKFKKAVFNSADNAMLAVRTYRSNN